VQSYPNSITSSPAALKLIGDSGILNHVVPPSGESSIVMSIAPATFKYRVHLLKFFNAAVTPPLISASLQISIVSPSSFGALELSSTSKLSVFDLIAPSVDSVATFPSIEVNLSLTSARVASEALELSSTSKF